MLLIPAYAKLNLGLVVRGRRADGMHEIASIAVTIDWHDLIGLRPLPAEERGGAEIKTTGPLSEGISEIDNASNLAVKAALTVADAVGADPERQQAGRPIEVWLDKRIPIAAGLGGGSADAAAVLRGCARLFGLKRQTVEPLAAPLGADVPALLRGGCLRMDGIGEILTPVPCPRLTFVVAVCNRSSTAETYRAVTAAEYRSSERIDRLQTELAAGRIPGGDLFGSDLEPAAFRVNPRLQDAATRLRAAFPDRQWHMTGSGGAFFTVAPPGDAAGIAAETRAVGFQARACRTVLLQSALDGS